MLYRKGSIFLFVYDSKRPTSTSPLHILGKRVSGQPITTLSIVSRYKTFNTINAKDKCFNTFIKSVWPIKIPPPGTFRFIPIKIIKRTQRLKIIVYNQVIHFLILQIQRLFVFYNFKPKISILEQLEFL